jgi:hypothetical protein
MTKRKKRASRRALQTCVLEALETRQLFSMLGVLPQLLFAPQAVDVSTGSLGYIAATPDGVLTVHTALTDDEGSPSGFAFSTLDIVQGVNASNGGGVTGTFTVTSGSHILLSGVTNTSVNPANPNQHGFGFDLANSLFDFEFTVTGGELSQYVNDDFGVYLETDPAGSFGGFDSSFQRSVKTGLVGIIPHVGSLPPQLFTVPNPTTVALGANIKINDSATLSGLTTNAAGAITFQLFDPANNLVDTEVAITAGNGTYSTPTGYLPLTVGTYKWVATYSDAQFSNVPTPPNDDESVVVTKATPKIITSASFVSGNVVGSAIPQDTAILSNGFNETGVLHFTLTGPGGFVDSEDVAVNGNGTYHTSHLNVATLVGTYTYTVSYAGDALNLAAVDQGGSAEQVTTVKASPKIVTCASLTGGNIVGAAVPQDSAIVSGGYNVTGNLVFTLKGPDLSTVYTEIVALSGNGTYSTHSTFVPTVSGTYTWSVSYAGNSLNNGAIDQGGAAEQVTIVKGGTITGKKYVDVKGDDCSTNIGSGDDIAYTGAGITIQLYQGSTLVATTITGADGSYSFTNLAAGTYTLKEVVPSGWVLTAQSSGSVTLTNGATSTGNNFADFKLICITGKKFLDLSGNGLSSDDTALGGVKIQLFKNGGSTPIATATTAADGSYSFSNLGPGTYTVKEVTPSGYLQTGPVSGSYSINATSGSTYDHRDFDNFKLDDCELTCISYLINGCTRVSDISGKLHQGDTVKVTFTISEPETVSFVSYTAPDPYFDANDASEQKIFDVATGVYTRAGTYSLTITVPNCYYQVDLVCGLPIDQLGPAGSNIFYTPQGRLHDSDNGGTTPCDCDTPTGTGSIAGSVYKDCNNNGIRDLGEAGIGGVKIKLTGTQVNGTAVTLYATTDSSGNYKFSNLKAGVYQVNETQPSDYYDGKDRVGSLGGTLGNDVLSVINLGSGQAGVNYTFGELDGASLAGQVYNDKDKDGCIDYRETGLCSVKLVLSGVNDLGQSVSYTTYTDANGNFSFDNVRQGTYTLTEYEPSGYATTKNVAGTEGGTVSGDKITNITLEWCDNATGYNFGEYRCY